MNGTSLVRLAAIASSAALVASCGGSDGTVYVTVPQETPPSVSQESVGTYLQTLPDWEEFSPPVADQPPGRVGEPVQSTERLDFPVMDSAGNVIGVRSEQYGCTTTKFSLKSTPEKIVMFSPDREILWPGAMLQGRSHRDGMGSLLPLTIRERSPIKVSIPSLATNDNFRTVELPDQAGVSQAIGSMVGNATTANLVAPSSIQYTLRDYRSDESFALQTKLSGRYLGFSASASASASTAANERTVMVYFLEKMFEVVVEPPQTPGAFFSADFTREKLDQQIAMGRIGPDNLPVYVSNIVYGRMMAFTFTSTASATDVQAALNAAYKGIFSASFSLDAKYKAILSEGKISVTSLGGSSRATVAMIASGDWRQYFTENAPLTSAYPISYTLRNLGDGSIAKVGEATEYNIKECEPLDTVGFMLDSFETEANWQKTSEANSPLTVALGSAATPQSIFYGYEWVKHTNLRNDDFFTYNVGYIKSPHFTGVQSDYYRGELSFWFRPDENMYTVGTGRRVHCYWKLVWPIPPIFDYRCVTLEFPISDVEPLKYLADEVAAWDDYTTADHVVLRGGGVEEHEVLTLTYNPKEATVPLQWQRRVIGLRNDDVAGNTLCDGNLKGCWLVEDRIATESEIQYVLQNVRELRIRASYPVNSKRKVCLDESPPAPPAPCVNTAYVPEPIPVGYVGGYFDEIKLTKPATGF